MRGDVYTATSVIAVWRRPMAHFAFAGPYTTHRRPTCRTESRVDVYSLGAP